MNVLISQSVALLEFLESGGYVLYAIFAAALIVWFLIGERYWYFLFAEPTTLREMLAEWQKLKLDCSQSQRMVRLCLISQFRQAAKKNLSLIKALTNISVLLGLLGTITGMIALFEGMALTQGGDVRLLADGVSRTIIPAMAGLVVAISGFYFSSRLEHRAARDEHKLADCLK